ncbi:class III extradiol dioxygenase subunit B-like domain-containing protein [Kribbella yunnanensis]|uniref:Class III extradiol dioxygenase subunit B-like domain-containing protein n=1 Tax=Kribbella yunnanensis TaxID=190194 RepID=A0ABP4VDA0_9ACTN
MPVVSAAVCPHPPLLVPEVATGAAPDLDELRAVCLAAVNHLAAADGILVIGAAPPAPAQGAGSGLVSSPDTPGLALGGGRGVWYDGSAGGGFGAYGAPSVRFGDGPAVLPLSLAIGGWLLEQSKAAGLPRTYRAIDPATPPADCLELGRSIAQGNHRIGLLVMGDGAPRRSEHSPVHLHPRAEIFDQTVAAALAAADADVLAALDPDLATELQAAGRAPWQVLAGALGDLQGDLRYDAAPYGVGYFVASFS